MTHEVPKDDIFIPKPVGMNFLLLYVYENVHMIGFNKNMLIRNARTKQHELKKMHKAGKNTESVLETDHSFSLIIHC